jgi:hypothetical protein
VLVTRSGGDAASAAYSAAGVLMPVFVDEVDPATGATLQTIALRSTAAGADGQQPCTLAAGFGGNFAFDSEGQPQLAGNGRTVVFPCYANASGTLLAGAMRKTVAVLRADGTVDTAAAASGVFTATTEVARQLATRSAATQDSATGAVYLSGTGTTGGGLWVVYPPASAATPVRGAPDVPNALVNDARYATVYNGVLYTSVGMAGNTNPSWYGIHAFAAGLPTGSYSDIAVATRLEGTQVSPIAGNATSPFAFVFESNGVLWLANDVLRGSFNLVRYTSATPGSQPWASTWTADTTVAVDASRRVEALTGRAEAGVFVLYMTTPVALLRFNTVTRVLTTVAAVAAGGSLHGVALPPTNPAFAVVAPASATPAPVAVTPSPSPVQRVSAFQASSILVLRAGAGAVHTAGTYMPAWMVEINPVTGDVLQEVPVPSEDGPTGYACTILTPGSGISESFPLLSGDGSRVTIPCNARPVNSTIGFNVARTTGVMRADGTFDTTQRLADAYFFNNAASAPSYFRSAWTLDGSEFWLSGRTVTANTSGANYWADSGVRYMRYGSGSSTQLAFPAGTSEARYCEGSTTLGTTAGGPTRQLVCAMRDNFAGNAFFGLQKVGDGMPTTNGQTVTNLAGLQSTTGSMWSWYMEPSGLRLWVGFSQPSNSIALYTRATAASAWAQDGLYIIDSGQTTYVLQPRYESGHLILYCSGNLRVLQFVSGL